MSVLNNDTITKILSLHVSLLDINECDPSGLSSEYQRLAHICDPDANCTNTKGSYNCGCQVGYAGNGKDCNGKKINLSQEEGERKGKICLVPKSTKAFKGFSNK